MFGIKRNSTLLAMAVLGIAAVAGSAQAAPQAAFRTGYNPFSVVGSSIVITAGGDTYITSAAKGWNNQLLLGIRSIAIIGTNNVSVLLTPTAPGYATNGTNTSNWVITANGDIAGNEWDSGDPGNGFPNGNNRNWISMQSASVMNSYGKLTNPLYNAGTFTFTGLAGLAEFTNFRIMIDAMVAPQTGSTPLTGEIYFTSGTNGGGTNGGGNGQTGSSGNGGDPVPEPGEWAAMGILSAGLMGLVAKSRRRRAA